MRYRFYKPLTFTLVLVKRLNLRNRPAFMVLFLILSLASLSLIMDHGLRNITLEMICNLNCSVAGLEQSGNLLAFVPILLGGCFLIFKFAGKWYDHNKSIIFRGLSIAAIALLISQIMISSYNVPLDIQSDRSDCCFESDPLFVEAQTTYSGEECLGCHRQVTPNIFVQWNQSKHGMNSVYCDSCHGSNHEALIWPTGQQCKSCHSTQVEQFIKGKHHLAWLAGDVIASSVLQLDETIAWKGCGYCHRIGSSGNTTNWGPNTPGVATTAGSKCDSCHTRHSFSIVEARKPEACRNCHMGFDHPTYEMYMSSKHGVIYSTRGDEFVWDYPYNEEWPNEAPVCITCHMDKGNHEAITAYRFYGVLGPDVGPLKEDSEWAADNAEVLKGLGVLTPDGQPGVIFDVVKDLRIATLSDEEFNQIIESELEICYRCHSQTYVDHQFNHYEEVTKQSIHLLAEGVRIVAELYEDGTIEKPESYPYNYPFMLAFYNSPTPIEQDLYLMLEKWHNRMFQGSFHESADYMHWEGYAPMKEHLVRMRAEAQRMRLEAKLEQTQPGAPIKLTDGGLGISEIVSIIATIIAVAAILLAVRTERKVKKTA